MTCNAPPATGRECVALVRRGPRLLRSMPLGCLTSCLCVAPRSLDQVHTKLGGGWGAFLYRSTGGTLDELFLWRPLLFRPVLSILRRRRRRIVIDVMRPSTSTYRLTGELGKVRNFRRATFRLRVETYRRNASGLQRESYQQVFVVGLRDTIGRVTAHVTIRTLFYGVGFSRQLFLRSFKGDLARDLAGRPLAFRVERLKGKFFLLRRSCKAVKDATWDCVFLSRLLVLFRFIRDQRRVVFCDRVQADRANAYRDTGIGHTKLNVRIGQARRAITAAITGCFSDLYIGASVKGFLAQDESCNDAVRFGGVPLATSKEGDYNVFN